MPEQFDRFRSFAERYIVSRGAHFELGKELEQGWQAILDARTLYKKIATLPIENFGEDMEAQGQMAGTMQAPSAAIPPQTLRAQKLAQGGPVGPIGPAGATGASIQQAQMQRVVGVGTKTWGQTLSNAMQAFTRAGKIPPVQLIGAIQDHIKKGGRI